MLRSSRTRQRGEGGLHAPCCAPWLPLRARNDSLPALQPRGGAGSAHAPSTCLGQGPTLSQSTASPSTLPKLPVPGHPVQPPLTPSPSQARPQRPPALTHAPTLPLIPTARPQPPLPPPPHAETPLTAPYWLLAPSHPRSPPHNCSLIPPAKTFACLAAPPAVTPLTPPPNPAQEARADLCSLGLLGSCVPWGSGSDASSATGPCGAVMVLRALCSLTSDLSMQPGGRHGDQGAAQAWHEAEGAEGWLSSGQRGWQQGHSLGKDEVCALLLLSWQVSGCHLFPLGTAQRHALPSGPALPPPAPAPPGLPAAPCHLLPCPTPRSHPPGCRPGPAGAGR